MEVPDLDRDIAKSIRNELITQIGRERYELWFGKNVTIACVEGEIQISSSQQFQLDQLRRRQGSEVHAACQRVLGRPAAISFRVTEHVSPPTTRPPCLPTTDAQPCHGSPDEKR